MKKIGIVSCYFKNNYGSMLQAYATKKILDNNNFSNETININSNIDFSNGKKKYYLSQIANFKFIKSKFGMIKLKIDKKVNKTLNKNLKEREKKFTEFRKEFNLSRATKTYDELTKLANERYSNIIVGSDQLWLPVNVISNYYTLNWVPEQINKISYSTSFGFNKINPKYNEIYRKFLIRINHLSVRELSGVEIISSVANLNAKLVCDPTILLTADEWEKEINQEPLIKEKYIFCYFLSSNTKNMKFAEKLKRETGYKIVSLNHLDEYVKYADIFADIVPYDIGPREWINLIKNAEYICTDSFHGTVFSILFNKIFFDFRRHSFKDITSTNNRIDSLLTISGISKERILSGEEDVKTVLKYNIDYKTVNVNISNFREESKQWLFNSLNLLENDVKHVDITSKEDCCGCSACANICPVKAITLKADKEGFEYPIIDEKKCTNCGLCRQVCPIMNKQKFNNFTQRAYLFQNSNDEVRKTSTSGGFFSSLAEYVISNKGYVYGAVFDADFVVKHIGINKKELLYKFRKSKYVQSNQNYIFQEIKEKLDNNQLVCYSGTPCQVAGLKAYLKKEYENLILLDMMCHSVPSPLVFEKYKQYILKKMNAKEIRKIDFRDKSRYGYKYSLMTVETDNGVYSQGIDTDPYLRAFFDDYSVRPSCYNCRFKTKKRVSDITIWDCYNIREFDKNFDDDKGTTRVLIQSEKGLKIINTIKDVKIKEIDINEATNNVKEMTNSVVINNKRDDFFEKINNDKVFDIFFPINAKTKIHRFIRKLLTTIGLYSFIKSKVKKFLNK